jgi:hypothetical protein
MPGYKKQKTPMARITPYPRCYVIIYRRKKNYRLITMFKLKQNFKTKKINPPDFHNCLLKERSAAIPCCSLPYPLYHYCTAFVRLRTFPAQTFTITFLYLALYVPAFPLTRTVQIE